MRERRDHLAHAVSAIYTITNMTDTTNTCTLSQLNPNPTSDSRVSPGQAREVEEGTWE